VVALDTSCVVALLCEWHEHHAGTTSAIEERVDSGADIAIAAPVLLEAYSVLTRLPGPWRLSPHDAFQLLRENFRQNARTVSLGADEQWSLLERAPGAGVSGGRTYDAVIAACARKADARELLTFNMRHFAAFADESLHITSPA
jgi:predicted nucleic acid-binding protein